MRNFLTGCILTLGILSLTTVVHAQVIDVQQQKEEDRRGSSILDDTTKQIYGPTTTRYYHEASVKFNRPEFHFVDTSIVNLHRFTVIPRSEFMYQDLGNIGTALNPVFPEVPDQIGATSGFTVYDPYYDDTDEIRYYDTKSPFSKFRIVWGGQGRALTEARYSRNINERTNFGFKYHGYFIDKQIERQGRGDRNAQGVYYMLHGSYISPNGRYRALGYFNRNRHVVQEIGGILTDTENPEDPIFFDENRQIALRTAETVELRTNYHLYHQYTIGKIAQLYHNFDRYKQQNDYNDENLEGNYWPDTVVSLTPVRDRSKVILYVNEVGIKGDAGKSFYSFYYKARNVDFDYKYLEEDTLDFDTQYLESFGGFNLRFGNDSLSYIEAFGELQLKGNYRLGGRIKNSWFRAEAISTGTEPTYIQKAYRGSHHEWVNDFDLPVTTKFSVDFRVPLGRVLLEPGASYSLRSNYVYFREDLSIRDINNDMVMDTLGYTVAPVQAGGDISVLSPQLRFRINFLKNFSLSSLVRYSSVSGTSADAVRVPELFTLTQLAYHNIHFKGNLELQVGIDLHWKSDYYAMGYDPALMQYFVQDRFEVYSYPLVDFFINGKINRGKFFLKVNNLYELISDTGYFSTPYYPGQTTIFDFGVDWAFYD